MTLASKQCKLGRKSPSCGGKIKIKFSITVRSKDRSINPASYYSWFHPHFSHSAPKQSWRKKWNWVEYYIYFWLQYLIKILFPPLTFIDRKYPERQRVRYSGVTCLLTPEKVHWLGFTLCCAARLLCVPELILCVACAPIYWSSTNTWWHLSTHERVKSLSGKL